MTELLQAAMELRDAADALTFSPPVAVVYNPLVYAWEPHRVYLEKWGRSPKRAVFVGMNPGPWGMAQVGVPFGEIGTVRDWMDIGGTVVQPVVLHPKRPVTGFACTRSEVSGRRLWGYFADRFGTADAFFQDHFVTNYCPLMFLDEDGRNITPDKLPRSDREALYRVCDAHLRRVVATLHVEWVIGVGKFSASRAATVAGDMGIRSGDILHPSPASPRANRDWRGIAKQQLRAMGVWE